MERTLAPHLPRLQQTQGVLKVQERHRVARTKRAPGGCQDPRRHQGGRGSSGRPIPFHPCAAELRDNSRKARAIQLNVKNNLKARDLHGAFRKSPDASWQTSGYNLVTFGDQLAAVFLEVAKGRAADLGNHIHPSTERQLRDKVYVDNGATLYQDFYNSDSLPHSQSTLVPVLFTVIHHPEVKNLVFNGR
jgi:hypothetical protein